VGQALVAAQRVVCKCRRCAVTGAAASHAAAGPNASDASDAAGRNASDAAGCDARAIDAAAAG
jgi:hypothetical protein